MAFEDSIVGSGLFRDGVCVGGGSGGNGKYGVRPVLSNGVLVSLLFGPEKLLQKAVNNDTGAVTATSGITQINVKEYDPLVE